MNIGLRAFKAVPENQVLVPINLPATPGLGKFGRPVSIPVLINIVNTERFLGIW